MKKRIWVIIISLILTATMVDNAFAFSKKVPPGKQIYEVNGVGTFAPPPASCTKDGTKQKSGNSIIGIFEDGINLQGIREDVEKLQNPAMKKKGQELLDQWEQLKEYVQRTLNGDLAGVGWDIFVNETASETGTDKLLSLTQKIGNYIDGLRQKGSQIEKPQWMTNLGSSLAALFNSWSVNQGTGGGTGNVTNGAASAGASSASSSGIYGEYAALIDLLRNTGDYEVLGMPLRDWTYEDLAGFCKENGENVENRGESIHGDLSCIGDDYFYAQDQEYGFIVVTNTMMEGGDTVIRRIDGDRLEVHKEVRARMLSYSIENRYATETQNGGIAAYSGADYPIFEKNIEEWCEELGCQELLDVFHENQSYWRNDSFADGSTLEFEIYPESGAQCLSFTDGQHQITYFFICNDNGDGDAMDAGQRRVNVREW